MSTCTHNWDAANTRACLLCIVIFDNFSSQDLPISSSSQERVKHFHGNGSSDYSEDDFKVMAIELNTIAGLMAGIRAFCAASNMEAFWLEKFRLVEKTLKHFAVFKFICSKWNEFTPSMLPHLPRKWNGWQKIKPQHPFSFTCFLLIPQVPAFPAKPVPSVPAHFKTMSDFAKGSLQTNKSVAWGPYLPTDQLREEGLQNHEGFWFVRCLDWLPTGSNQYVVHVSNSCGNLDSFNDVWKIIRQ